MLSRASMIFIAAAVRGARGGNFVSRGSLAARIAILSVRYNFIIPVVSTRGSLSGAEWIDVTFPPNPCSLNLPRAHATSVLFPSPHQGIIYCRRSDSTGSNVWLTPWVGIQDQKRKGEKSPAILSGGFHRLLFLQLLHVSPSYLFFVLFFLFLVSCASGFLARLPPPIITTFAPTGSDLSFPPV